MMGQIKCCRGIQSVHYLGEELSQHGLGLITSISILGIYICRLLWITHLGGVRDFVVDGCSTGLDIQSVVERIEVCW